MSNDITTLCRAVQLSPAQKVVLMCLADYARDDGSDWHSIAGIMEWTCLGKTAVIAAMKSLEAQGLIRRVHRGSGLNSMTLVQVDTIRARPEVVKALANRSAYRTGPPTEPVREANPTSPPPEPDRSACRSSPVRQTDPKHQEASVKHQKQQRGSRLCPPGFQVTPELQAWAQKECPGIDTGRETAKFRLHERSKPASDWPRAWQKWMLNAAEFAAKRAPRRQQPAHFAGQHFTEEL